MKRVSAITGIAIFLFSSVAFADDEDLTLQLIGWGRTGAQATVTENDETVSQYIGLARLATRAKYDGVGGFFLQLAGESGDVTVLDLFATLHLGSPFSLDVGRQRVPTSIDFMTPAPFMSFVNRSRLVSMLTTRALGIQAHYSIGSAAEFARLSVGWFRPNNVPSDIRGFELLSARALLTPNDWVTIHAAFITSAFSEDGIDVASFRPFDRQADVGLKLTPGLWTFYAEGLVNFEQIGDETSYATYAHLLRKFEYGEQGWATEPGMRYDLFNPAGDISHRVTAGVNQYFVGDFLKASAAYQLTLNGETEHALFLQLQGGFSATIAP